MSTPAHHKPLPDDFQEKAAGVKLLCLDVDGTLTDGGLYINEDNVETRRFCVHDGQGITAWHRLGFTTAIITARPARSVRRRAKDLGIAHLHDNVSDKRQVILDVLKTLDLTPTQAAFVGDDLSDLRAMHTVACPIAVGDADQAIKDLALLTTAAPGGHGAVREAIWAILKAQDRLDQVMALYS
ncbi:MAG: HAD hydrolase family protein [Phycisphaerales bacterium]|jgi:3-deoxy-D-manno-octulosonate 8-phosphate phosphatase (KDO 8-P phosphatase)